MDPRAARSRAALRESVFRIASERRIESVTTTEVARAAGLTRGTVYNHGKTPAELLEQLLSDELGVVRAQFWSRLERGSVRDGFLSGVRDAVAHVTRHLAIYELALARPASPSVHHILSDHFAATLGDFFRANPTIVSVPAGFDREADLDATIDTLAAYAAHGVVGAIEVWLAHGPKRNVELLIATIASTIPTRYFVEPTEPAAITAATREAATTRE